MQIYFLNESLITQFVLPGHQISGESQTAKNQYAEINNIQNNSLPESSLPKINVLNLPKHFFPVTVYELNGNSY